MSRVSMVLVLDMFATTAPVMGGCKQLRHPRAKDCGSNTEHGWHTLRPWATPRWQSGACAHRRIMKRSLDPVASSELMFIDASGDRSEPNEDVDMFIVLTSEEVSSCAGGA